MKVSITVRSESTSATPRTKKKWPANVLSVFRMLERQDFEDFYRGELQAYIEGEEDAPSADEICEKIQSLLK